MARIHVIYDPNDRVDPPNAQIQKQLGVSVAVLTVNDNIEQNDIIKTTSALTTLLLERLVAGESN